MGAVTSDVTTHSNKRIRHCEHDPRADKINSAHQSIASMKSSVLPSPPAGAQDIPAAAPEAPAPSAPRLQSGLHPAVWWCVALLAALGTIGMSQTLFKLWDIWTDDPLKSLGMLIVPVSVILTLRVWRETGWELRGNWWGLLPVTLGLSMSAFRHAFGWMLYAGPVSLNLVSPKIALYLFGSGFVLLFAGAHVWRRAWFPLALLLCAQPMPYFFLIYGDVPLQDLSAHVARSFAVLIGFPATSKELLRMMFTPNFGMFIAPGCDGVRGALTLGYLALITGYLKKVSVLRWISYVAGGVLLGYLFNLIRLCALVVYYRAAVGHPRMEHFAEQADYIIGGCLFLVAALLFLWIVSRKDEARDAAVASSDSAAASIPRKDRLFPWRAAAFAVPALFFAVPGIQAIRTHRASFAAEVRTGAITPAQLDALLPQQLGGFTLNRAWQETANGRVLVESGAYQAAGRDEAILGVWVPSWAHNMHVSWMARGEDPLLRGERTFLTAQGTPASFDTAFYSDGITDSIAGNVYCTPTGFIPAGTRAYAELEFSVDPPNFDSPGKRAVPIFFRIDRPHSAAPQAAVFEELKTEAQQFLAGVDFIEISKRFQ
jgi:exosortase J